MYMIHSDVINGDTCKYTETTPFSTNQTSAAKMFVINTTPAGTPVFATKIATKTLKPITPPYDKSIPPCEYTKIAPNAIIAIYTV